jgi:hypothetical protein
MHNLNEVSGNLQHVNGVRGTLQHVNGVRGNAVRTVRWFVHYTTVDDMHDMYVDTLFVAVAEYVNGHALGAMLVCALHTT